MKRKPHNESASSERWLVSYADLITLLFAFFVILYGISSADAKKLKALSQGMKDAFSEQPRSNKHGAAPKSLEGKEATFQLVDVSKMIREGLDLEMGTTDVAGKVQLVEEPNRLIMRFMANDFYETGHADVRAEALPVVNQIAKTLKRIQKPVRVEGHTDNAKVVSELYASNWELSAARATWMVRYFIQKHEINPELLVASGYAEFHPLADNASDEGRAKNRRVEVVVYEKTE